MIEYEQEYLQWITDHGVGDHDQVASSPKSYISYLKSVSKRIEKSISPLTLSSKEQLLSIALDLVGQAAQSSIEKYKSAMSHYVEMVRVNGLKPTAKFQTHPTKKLLIKDLLASVNFDVSDWVSNTDPKYCYDWSFSQNISGEQVIVLCLWYEMTEEKSNTLFQNLNLRRTAANALHANQKKRALKTDELIRTSFENNIPLHVILSEGRSEEVDIASKTKKRNLDSIPWQVTTYDFESGNCTLTRGFSKQGNDHASNVDDTFDDTNDLDYSQLGSDGGIVSSCLRSYVKRDRHVRSAVIQRAQGICEYERCGASRDFEGFLDVHHILGAAKSDRYWNCVALCPNCHREAHSSPNRDGFNASLLKYASEFRE